MFHVFISQRVLNIRNFRKNYDAFWRRNARRMGVKRRVIYQDPVQRSRIMIRHDCATEAKARALSRSRKMLRAMREAGMKRVAIWITRDIPKPAKRRTARRRSRGRVRSRRRR